MLGWWRSEGNGCIRRIQVYIGQASAGAGEDDLWRGEYEEGHAGVRGKASKNKYFVSHMRPSISLTSERKDPYSIRLGGKRIFSFLLVFKASL